MCGVNEPHTTKYNGGDEMTDNLKALVAVALKRNEIDMLPTLVMCDAADEEGYDTSNIRKHVKAVLDLLDVKPATLDTEIQIVQDINYVNWYIKHLKKA